MSAVHRTVGGANASVFQSRVNEAMEALYTFHSAAKGIEWYEQTPNDEYQTIPAMCPFRLSSRVVAPPVSCFLLHPVMTDPRHNFMISSNTLTNFSEGQSAISKATLSGSNSESWS
ncbi:hypothetical protein TNCV_4797651 [Trichonephila clavipes]|nr:hypothetical protein TNCV_4797651 [Trichonephila clavipes]